MTSEALRPLLQHTRDYLVQSLLPFWLERAPDPECGGVLTWFDRDGRRTGETDKTFLMQARVLYAMSLAHRAGFGEGRCATVAHAAAEFLTDHFWDDAHGGWIWVTDRWGRPLERSKIGYGQCFGMYAFAEYWLATGDAHGREWMDRTHDVVMRRMRDRHHGGFFELMESDWTPKPRGAQGGDRKSFDVHMHMMEALTSVYEVTRERPHRAQLLEVIDLIRSRILHPVHGTGRMQFALDWTPLPAIRLATVSGRDEEPDDTASPVDTTSYGHDVEFAWLLWHAADVLGVPRRHWADAVRGPIDHCLAYGIDDELGGIYVDGIAGAPATDRRKQFWQHAEALVGLLDAWLVFREDRYLDAFLNVHRFVFERFVHLGGGGEWFGLLERDGSPLRDQLGTGFKTCYHTVRSMIEVVGRLRLAVDGPPATNPG